MNAAKVLQLFLGLKDSKLMRQNLVKQIANANQNLKKTTQ
jgi:hypothetical protein